MKGAREHFQGMGTKEKTLCLTKSTQQSINSKSCSKIGNFIWLNVNVNLYYSVRRGISNEQNNS